MNVVEFAIYAAAWQLLGAHYATWCKESTLGAASDYIDAFEAARGVTRFTPGCDGAVR